MIEAFHFLRPAWLLLLPLLIGLLVWLRQSESQPRAWAAYIAPALLKVLQHAPGQPGVKRWPWFALVWTLAIVALAGPSWQRLPTPVTKSEAATVFIVDLSPSMLAEDVKPSRVIRAQQKLTDALGQQRDGLQALIAYAGEAHLVAPLTDDARTLRNLVPALTPAVMPLTGSNVEMAVQLAIDTLQAGKIQTGRLLLFTDGITEDAKEALQAQLSHSPYPLYIIGLGDETGVPIPLGDRGFAKDRNGNIVIVKNERALLKAVAASGGGHYQDMTISDADIRFLADPISTATDSGRQVNRDFDTWRDAGIWLVWMLLPLAAYSFRRNWLYALPLLIGLNTLPAQTTQAQVAQSDRTEQPLANSANDTPALSNWDSLWLNANQRGHKALRHNKPAEAAQQFDDPRWRASAHYKAEQYQAAVDSLLSITQSSDARADDFYNLGNAQARAGLIDPAMDSYAHALRLQPDMADAKANLALLEELKKQQQKQSDQQNPQQGEPQDDDTEQDKSGRPEPSPQDGNSTGDGGENQSQSTPGDDAPANTGEDAGDSQNSTPPDEGQLQNFEDSNLPPEQQTAAPSTEPSPSNDREASVAKQPAEDTESSEARATGAVQPNDALDHLDPEERQAVEQWLRQVEDDPTGLLKRKFEYQYRQRRAQIKQGEWQAPENDAHERW